jgi:hypothetical protein
MGVASSLRFSQRHDLIMNIHDLRKSPLFQGLSDEELKKHMDMGVHLKQGAGELN